jgi:hypothetical protein
VQCVILKSNTILLFCLINCLGGGIEVYRDSDIIPSLLKVTAVSPTYLLGKSNSSTTDSDTSSRMGAQGNRLIFA